jgi:hypothetical protein
MSKWVLGDNCRVEERDVHQMGVRGETLGFPVVQSFPVIRFFWKQVHF